MSAALINQSYGIGYLEYLEFAEDLGAEPLPVLSVGANGCGSNIPEMHDQAQIDRPPPFFQGVLDQQAVVWIVVGQ